MRAVCASVCVCVTVHLSEEVSEVNWDCVWLKMDFNNYYQTYTHIVDFIHLYSAIEANLNGESTAFLLSLAKNVPVPSQAEANDNVACGNIRRNEMSFFSRAFAAKHTNTRHQHERLSMEYSFTWSFICWQISGGGHGGR